MLAVAPQAWTSDDTDAVERIAIQWGTSMVYPLSAISAHVSAVPNHQVGRVTPLATRAAVAFFGVFGYELDPTALSDVERAGIAGQIDFYRQHRDLLQRGRFVRLVSPFEGDRRRAAWMVVSHDGRQAVAAAYSILNRPTPAVERLRLRGLDPAATYHVSTWPGDSGPIDRANTGERSGADLMSAGLSLSMDRHEAALVGDFRAVLFVLEAT
jgi:alpha-galactosidase